jgi:hypothetical protein
MSNLFESQSPSAHAVSNRSGATPFLIGGGAVMLLALLIVGIMVRRKHRATILRKQIDMLEKVWKLDYKETNS